MPSDGAWLPSSGRRSGRRPARQARSCPGRSGGHRPPGSPARFRPRYAPGRHPTGCRHPAGSCGWSGRRTAAAPSACFRSGAAVPCRPAGSGRRWRPPRSGRSGSRFAPARSRRSFPAPVAQGCGRGRTGPARTRSPPTLTSYSLPRPRFGTGPPASRRRFRHRRPRLRAATRPAGPGTSRAPADVQRRDPQIPVVRQRRRDEHSKPGSAEEVAPAELLQDGPPLPGSPATGSQR